ncbi:MAG TPA: ribokinase [Anaeromyxobacter sp.]|nr:ribokinase [Anaeromyxobacter sp.]
MVDPEVVVVGSINMDLVVRTVRLPEPGETVSGKSFAQIPGGKGANQAVAAARLGARTAMVGCLGDDAFGAELERVLAADGIDCRAVRKVPGVPTGVALIEVDDAGRNHIVVVPGGNGRLEVADVRAQEKLLAGARAVVLQLEIPLETVIFTAARARALGKLVVLNPAPAQPLPPELLAAADYLVPNELEAAALTGCRVDSPAAAEEAARSLRGQGARNVIVTLGALGVLSATEGEVRHHPARPVRAVDSTAAGDTFIGGLCTALVEGRSLDRAVAFAQAAAAISVTRPGAQTSIPRRDEVLGV